MKQNKYFLKALLSTLLLVTFYGCGESPDSSDNEITKQEREEPKELKEWEITFPAEPPYDDKEFWSEPRIQFVWFRHLKENDWTQTPEIFSMKLDGSDIRLALGSDLLLGPEKAVMNHPPVRSPNNRYIVASLSSKKHYLYKVLVDLKTKERTIIAKGGAAPDFNWTPDSENIIFYLDDYMKNYNVKSKKLTDRPIIYSLGIYLLNDGKTFLATEKEGYRLHNFNGTLIEKITIPGREVTEHNYLSADNKYLYFYDGGPAYIYDLDKREVVFETKKRGQTNDNCITILPESYKMLFQGAWDDFFLQDINNKNKVEPYSLNPRIRVCDSQIINYK